MKRYMRKSLMLSAIIWITVSLVSFLCFEYQEEMKFNFLVILVAFLSMAIHYITSYIFYDSFLKELLWKYGLVEGVVLTVGVLSGWFVKANWWMSFVYVTPVFVLAYFFGIVQMRRDIQVINQKLAERKVRGNGAE